MDTLANVKIVCDRRLKINKLKSYTEIGMELGWSNETVARLTKSAMEKATQVLQKHGMNAEDFFGHEYFTNMEIENESTH